MNETAHSAFSGTIIEVLEPYKRLFDAFVTASIDRFGPKNDLRDACAYALTNPAKRFRPALVYMVAEALGNTSDVSESALAVECFHTASLIADDLPCMDNDDFRRGMPTLHKQWNESIALLASYALIAHGFECIAHNGNALTHSHKEVQTATELAAKTMGSVGLIGGQFFDLFRRELTEKNLNEIIEKKTGALFTLSFALGWIFGGGALEKLPLLHAASSAFGTAFQIIDDIDDMYKDRKANNPINYANAFGLQKAVATTRASIASFDKALAELSLHSEPLRRLSQAMQEVIGSV